MYQYVLGFPDKADQRAEPGSGWTPAELNHILAAHVVDSAVTTFGCVEWESQLFRGVMRARCYPFNWQSRKLQKSRMLPANHRTSVGRRLARVAKEIMPDWNEVWTASWWVCTCTSLVHTSMYWSVQNAVGKLRQDILVLWTVANEAGCVECLYGATQANECCLIT